MGRSSWCLRLSELKFAGGFIVRDIIESKKRKLEKTGLGNSILRQVRNEIRDIKDSLDTLVGNIERFKKTADPKLLRRSEAIIKNIESSAIRKLRAVLSDAAIVQRIEVELIDGVWDVIIGPLASGNWEKLASFDDKEDAIESAERIAKQRGLQWAVVS